MKVLSKIENNEDAITKKYVDDKAGVTAVDPTSGAVATDFFIPTKTSDLTNDSGFITSAALTSKQDTLVSGTNIKTINNESILGSGNISISGGSATDVQVNGTSIMSGGVANLLTKKPYNANTNKLATVKDLTEWSVASDEDDFITFFGANAKTYGINLSNDDETRYYTIYADKTSDMVSLRSSGKIALEGNAVTISNVVTPVNGGDAVNKGYVDGIVGDIESLLGGI